MKVLFTNNRPGYPVVHDGGAIQDTISLIDGYSSKGIECQWLFTLKKSQYLRFVESSYFEDPLELGLKLKHYSNYSVFQSKHKEIIVYVTDEANYSSYLDKLLICNEFNLLITWLSGSEIAIKISQKYNQPVLLRVLDIDNKKGFPKISNLVKVLANSQFVSDYVSDYYQTNCTWLPPLVNSKLYSQMPKVEEKITMINPRREKGGELFTKIVRQSSSLEFLVVKGWSWCKYDKEELCWLNELEKSNNVEIIEPCANIIEVLKRTKILLFPSLWEEAWGRVITEAQLGGIPVVGSNRGAIPFNIGKGGLILNTRDPNDWLKKLNKIYYDKKLYQTYSQLAIENVKRFNYEEVLNMYINFTYKLSTKNIVKL